MADTDDEKPHGEEARRLAAADLGHADWRLWGTFLAERQWGSVREDYSPDGDAWNSFPHDDARARAYRWNEDGLLGWCDRDGRLCFSTALWNGRDGILKERLFGLGNSAGNHGEDVKELYYYLDGTPTGSYAKALYKYPQAAFPYADLVETNKRRGLDEAEYELLDTGVFDGERYFDVGIEYAKQAVDDTLIRLTISNRGPEASDVTVLPSLAFRNTWSWDGARDGQGGKPGLHADPDRTGILADDDALGRYRFSIVAEAGDTVETLFTENETDAAALGWGGPSPRFAKAAFHHAIVHGDSAASNPERSGTKAAFVVHRRLDPGTQHIIRLRLCRAGEATAAPMTPEAFDACLASRIAEADAFYAERHPPGLDEDAKAVARQAFAGLLWSKQVYRYDVKTWLAGDPGQPPPPPEHAASRNANWRHLICHDVISMPDKWEYPWFAAWDLAFHMMPMAEIDPGFAKAQLLLMLEERYLHPNGALPAYEWNFDDVNPPVHAMAVLGVFERDRQRSGEADLAFLERAFHRLLLNFTWWVNRNDASGKDLFGGGFLGLDNIGLFDRSQPADGATVNQADATAWMGLFCSSMLTIAVELAQTLPVYQDMAFKFFHHYLLIIDAINRFGGDGLWDEQDGFFYDQISFDGKAPVSLKVQSIVGFVPLFAVGLMRPDQHANVPDLVRQIEAGLAANPAFAGYICKVEGSAGPDAGGWVMALTPKDRLVRLLGRLLDEAQFLSPHGIRSVSRIHADHPCEVAHDGKVFKVDYVPGEGNSRLFGGNSNWRGPVWFPINILIINALERFHDAYGDDLRVECPVGSGCWMTLREVAADLARRLSRLFLRDDDGRRPCHGDEARYARDPHWRDLVLFSEYFHGDTGRGLGASHQTGWTATVVSCLRPAP